MSDPRTTTDERMPSITVCPDGPLIVRGDIALRTPTGETVTRRRRTIALCRCGATGTAPYCDGSHKVTGYRSADPQLDQPPPGMGDPSDGGQ